MDWPALGQFVVSTGIKLAFVLAPTSSSWNSFGLRGAHLEEAKEGAAAIGARVVAISWPFTTLATVLPEAARKCKAFAPWPTIVLLIVVVVAAGLILLLLPVNRLRGTFRPLLVVAVVAFFDGSIQYLFLDRSVDLVCLPSSGHSL